MTQQLVTLESPDGRRHRTDNASEINMLIGTYGYRRVEQEQQEQTAKSARTKSNTSAKPTPSASATAESPEQSPPEASSS